MCSILCWILSMWEALSWIFLHFCLDSCIANKGEKLELEMACWMHLEGFQVVVSHFWAQLHTGLTGRSPVWPVRVLACSYVGHRSDRWWWPVWPVRPKLMQLLCFLQVVCMHSSRGSCIGSGGACLCAGELFVVFRALVWWFALFAWA
jgi:hypothetical protein